MEIQDGTSDGSLATALFLFLFICSVLLLFVCICAYMSILVFDACLFYYEHFETAIETPESSSLYVYTYLVKLTWILILNINHRKHVLAD